jgi:hypothetical protein
MTYWICPICYAVEHVSVSAEASGALCRLHQFEAKWNARTKQDPWAPLLAAAAERDRAERARALKPTPNPPSPRPEADMFHGKRELRLAGMVIVLNG